MSIFRWLKDRWAYALALLPILTDWIDTGHWPHHPREFATELVISAVLCLCVHRLLRKAAYYRGASETDALTGLGNRLRFRLDLEAKIESARKAKTCLTLAYVDANHFKTINDTLGHEAGDSALKAVGDALARSIREGTDGAYRLGGDEFAVLMLGADLASAHAALDRGFARGSVAPPLSCSVGIVKLRGGERADEFVRRADSLMYAAKRRSIASARATGGVQTILHLGTSGLRWARAAH